MRVLVAIGCNDYLALDRLSGAEEDARRVWAQLVGSADDQYDLAMSHLLMSPTLHEVREVLADLPTTSLEVLTIFFAGHGGVKAGSYCFCFVDSQLCRLATTALPLGSLLAVISELQPRQVNLIVDACESGGGMFDFPSVMRHGALGEDDSVGISVFAACGSQEYAAEDTFGGIATNELLKYLDGQKVLQTTRPYLDLVEVGRAVSAHVGRSTSLQTPVAWGINLQGESTFARNPSYIRSGVAIGFPELHIRPYAGTVAETFGTELWEAHQQVASEVLPHQLIPLLRRIADHLVQEKHDLAAFFRGLSTSLGSFAADSKELLAESHVIDCLITVLLGRESQAGVASLVRDLLSDRCDFFPEASRRVQSLLQERFGLVNHQHALADLFFLPVRITSTLGWISSHLLIANLLGRPAAEEYNTARRIADDIIEKWGDSIVAMSDVQATGVFSFGVLCYDAGWSDLAEQFIARMFCDLALSKGVVARLGLTPAQMLQYLTGRSDDLVHIYPRLLANPSNVLSATLLCGAIFCLDDVWDPDLIRLDHRACNFFIPDSYAAFGEVPIEAGVNHGLNIGHGVWTLDDLRSFLRGKRTDIGRAAAGLTPSQLASAIAASHALPDRLPLFTHLL